MMVGGDDSYGFVCAIRNRFVYCWGYNGYGQVGSGNTNSPIYVPAVCMG